MALFLWLDLLLLLLAGVRCTSVKNCHAGCRCEVESFGLFDSFSLTTVDCRGLGPGAIMPVAIPLDTAFLDLSSNALGHLTDNMLAGPGYTTLVSLDLSSNNITKVSPNALSKLRYLETLDLSHNDLEGLPPDCFFGLPLAEVDLSHNNLRDFNMSAFVAKVNSKPVSVDLSHNKLASISTTPHGKLVHIQNLNLTGNRLSGIPNLGGLEILRYLSLDSNPIVAIEEGDFAHLTDLVFLSLSSLRQLREIESNSFKGLRSLQVLDLSNNPKLKTLRRSVFTGLDSLQELNLSGCGVTFLPHNTLSHLPAIKSIALGQNIRCLRTQKRGVFHRQLGQTQHYEVLNCHRDSLAL
ncbi:tsukushi [Hippocampus zosterae]|uniref:tsukushi n=1 Tax=Hippocampus zosterae TaxID=109293 RepID=UPI00223E22FE|nr:tsukushi [Hippocampus zosterae]